MALLFVDSFNSSGSDGTAHATKYAAGSFLASNAMTATNPRTGTYSCAMFTSADISKTFSAASGSTAVIGFAVYATGVSNDLEVLYIKETQSTTHVTLIFDSAGAAAGKFKLKLYRGTTTGTLLGTASQELSLESWYYLELKVVISDAAGSYELRVDGVNVLSASGVDTRNSGTSGVFDTIRFRGSAAVTWRLADLYVLDGVADPDIGGFNTFLGPQSIGWCIASSGDGANADWTPSTGSDNGAMVDEANPDDDTTYNASSTVNQKDTYILSDPTLVGNINAVQAVLRMKKTDNSARTIKTVFRSNSTDYDQTEKEVLTTYSYLTEVRTTDPNTSLAWTEAAVDALQVGPKVFS